MSIPKAKIETARIVHDVPLESPVTTGGKYMTARRAALAEAIRLAEQCERLLAPFAFDHPARRIR